MSNSIRVLQVLHDFKKGGVQSEVMWPARLLSREDVSFDVVLFSGTEGYYEKEFKKYGCIFRIILPERKGMISKLVGIVSNFFFVKNEMMKILMNAGHYDAMHVHHPLYNAPCLLAAKKMGIPVRIAHCAVNKPLRKDFRDRLYIRLYYRICSWILQSCATNLYGVTQNASDYIFGKGKGRMLKNPTLDLERFNPARFDEKKDSVLTLIMIGSYSPRKNQNFAVDVLKCLLERGKDTRLVFIGYPRSAKEDYFPRLQKKVKDLSLDAAVEFLPQDTDIPMALSKSDFLLIPSLQEGLPNVTLEAQAMGVPCIISDDVSDDCNCGLCSFIPLDSGAEAWADFILDEYEKRGEKHPVDMSAWDNKKVCKEYLEIWRGNMR